MDDEAQELSGGAMSMSAPEAQKSESESASSGESSPAEEESLVGEIRSGLDRIRDRFMRTVQVEWQGVKLHAIDATFRAAFLLCLFGFALATSISGALLIAVGLRGAIIRWSGAEWIGDLGAGGAMLAIGIAALLVVRARLRSGCVTRAKRAADEKVSNRIGGP